MEFSFIDYGLKYSSLTPVRINEKYEVFWLTISGQRHPGYNAFMLT